MRKALLALAVSGCSTVLGIDDLHYVGQATDAATDATTDAALDAKLEAQTDAALCNGHDCLGGACSNGVCQPLPLVTLANLQPTLASDGAYVFFRTSTEVDSCPVTGCAMATKVATSTATGAVAVSTLRVYWSEATTIQACTKTSCASPSLLIDLGGLGVTGLAASPELLSVFAAGSQGNTLGVWRSALDGSQVVSVITQSIASSTAGPVASATGGTRAYWAQIGTPIISYCNAQCGTNPDGMTVALPISATAMVATPSNVFFATSTGVFRVDQSLSQTASGFAGGGTIHALALSTGGDTLYFAEALSGSTSALRSCATNVATCPTPVDVHLSSAQIVAIAVDSTAVYWIEGNTIMRLALP